MQRKWWHDKVAYQIYPKSFRDSNGDGVGDLRGIIEKLDYLAELGIEILWLSPVFRSPQADQGYDISDYYAIDPCFGTMEDMDELIAQAKKRGIFILMDLVVNHCSDEHEWFRKACENPDGKYGKYFYIENGKDGSVPTNWRSYFGGSVWDKLPGHDDKYYMHLFHKKQPDLNWENEEVRKDIYDMVNWWLEKGLGGFRVDAIINIKKELPLRDYKVDRADGLASVHQMLAAAEGVGEFLNELKQETFAKYGAFVVGEVFDIKEDELKDFISDEGYFSSMFDFSTTLIGQDERGWHKRRLPTPEQYISAIYKSQKEALEVGFLSNIIENHDEPRGVSHYLATGNITPESKKMLALINLMVRGLPFIYQGQEIGMENMAFDSVEMFDDIATLDAYEVALKDGLSKEEALACCAHYSRDNSRTPMQWDTSENAGFGKGKTWLPVNPNYTRINVAAQREDSDSLWHFYKDLIRLRKSEEYKEVIVYGDFEPFTEVSGDVMAFYRRYEEKCLLIIANFKDKEDRITLPKEAKAVLISNTKEVLPDGKTLTLSPYQALVLEL